MCLTEIVKQAAVQATNDYAVAHGIPTPYAEKAVDAYRLNANANVWDDLDRLTARKDSAMRRLIELAKVVAQSVQGNLPKTAQEINNLVAEAEDLL